MDGLIRTAWRAFWVGLGASAVLIAQSVVAPAAPSPVPADPAAAPFVASPAPIPRAQNTPRASRSPLTVHCASIANVLRCS